MNFYIQWDFTNSCNLKCKHCYKNNEIKEYELEINKCFEICDIINKMAIKNNLKISLSITGGEPFSRKEDLFKILNYIDKLNGIESFQLLSNGLLIKDEDIEKLTKMKKLNGIQISLESPNKETHEEIRGKETFDKTIEIIKKLTYNNIKVHVMMTISKKNINEIIDMYNLLKKINVFAFGADRFIPETDDDFDKYVLNKEEFENMCQTMFDLSKKDGLPNVRTNRAVYCMIDKNVGGACSAGKYAFAILPNGDILPCRRLKIKVGNILSEDIIDIWNKNEIMINCRNVKKLEGKCNTCEMNTRCGGCRAMAYAITHNYLAEDPLCWKK